MIAESSTVGDEVAGAFGPTRHRRGGPFLVGLFASALFSSAFLLFSLEPMVAKALLPKLGGTPMVWNTCMVFFQGTLLGGYLLAHSVVHSRHGQGRGWMYAAVLVGALLVLPIAFTREPAVADQPAAWLLLDLLRVVGLPALALSMSAPALQAWFASTTLPGAQDPYFLYTASNAGSLLALVSYPTIIEPRLGLHPQSVWWAAGYAGFAVAACACVAVRRSTLQTPVAPADGNGRSSSARWQRLRWVTLACIPSSLMLGVTTYISTDIAAVPLIWVLPLALYLTTFVVAFGRFSARATTLAERRFPLLAVVAITMMAANVPLSLRLTIPLHLAVFAGVAMMCHGRLAAERPPANRLTEFYVLLSLGGMIGGLFNALVAPLVFTSVTEYPAVLVCACAVPFMRSSDGPARSMAGDIACAAGTAAFIALANIALGETLGSRAHMQTLLMGTVALAAFSQMRRPRRFSLMLAAMLVASAFTRPVYGAVLHAERTFFGSYHVSVTQAGRFNALYHGTTLHGLQALDDRRRNEPLAYYHRLGPFGQAFERLAQLHGASDVAVVGLGVGSLAAYASERQEWTFFEIDPAVERIARDTRLFGFLRACDSRCRVAIGDARLSLARSDARFDFIVLDAFSSDSIPVHLVTREAFDLYLRRLTPGGVLLFHVSNRYLRLGDILGRLAEDRGLAALEQIQHVDAAAAAAGQSDSDWVVVSADRDALAPLGPDRRWSVLAPPHGTPLWTDDFSNILAALRGGR